MTIDINTLSHDDIIDVRDIIERIEELEDELEQFLSDTDDTCIGDWEDKNPEEGKELRLLQAIMEDLKGNGGDEQWRGDWYPVTLIRESHFDDYIEELIHDCYEMPKEMHSGSWPYRHMKIDYEAAADEAKVDYSEVRIDGVNYLYR